MSICYNKQRKKYYISYALKTPDGSFKTFNIYNKEWTKERGKKFLQVIEMSEIEKDKKKRMLLYHSEESLSLQKMSEFYLTECESTLKIQTTYNKKLTINKYILPNFNSIIEMDKSINIKNVEIFKSTIISLDAIDSHHKNRIFKLLLEILEYAADHEYISYELYRKVKVILKPIRSPKSKNKDKLVFWTNEEWDKFYATFEDNDIWKFLFKTAYICALRIGELIPLKWSDFNPTTKRINIDKSMDSHGNLSDAKTDSSHADVSLSNDLVEELVKLKIDMHCNDDDYIFFATNHTSRTTIRRIMNQHALKANLTTIKFHGLRHSCASRLINAGVSPLLVSKHLRHSSVKETLDTYSHLFPSETEGIIDKIFNN